MENISCVPSAIGPLKDEYGMGNNYHRDRVVRDVRDNLKVANGGRLKNRDVNQHVSSMPAVTRRFMFRSQNSFWP